MRAEDPFSVKLYICGIFGKVVANIDVIEFQRRGLPHAHLLLILENNYKFRTTDDYDNTVCAELPNPITYIQPKLYSMVTACMIHGPYGDAIHKRPLKLVKFKSLTR